MYRARRARFAGGRSGLWGFGGDEMRGEDGGDGEGERGGVGIRGSFRSSLGGDGSDFNCRL